MALVDSIEHILPELFVTGTMVVLFLLDALLAAQAQVRRWVFPAVTLAGLAAALALLLAEAMGLGGWRDAGVMFGSAADVFGGLLRIDAFATFVRGLALVATMLAVVLGIGSPSLSASRRVEYHGLLMLLVLGMCLLASANHLLMVYVAIETVSLACYMLAGFDERGGRSAEAGLKYVLFGGVASGVMLFGFSLLFGLFGALSLPGLGERIAHASVLGGAAGQWAALLAVVFVLAGFGFKIAAVPFHQWCPDVYEGAPTPFVALLSVGPKAAGFAVLVRAGAMLFPAVEAGTATLAPAVPWVLLLGILATLTMTIGNLSALWQSNLKRLLAYSSIAHAGYLLMGVVAGGSQGRGALVVYLTVYVMMNIGAFAVVSAVDRARGSEDISAYRGLGRRSPLLAVAMAVFLVSLAGLPPTAGFVGKLYLFAALIKHGGFWYVTLAVVGVVNSVVSLYFYARVLKAIYFESPAGDVDGDADGARAGEPKAVGMASSAAMLAVGLAGATLVLGIFWQPLAEMATWSGSLF